jgi:hypothetical protein
MVATDYQGNGDRQVASLRTEALRASVVELSRVRLKALRWQPEYFALATAGMWLLGDAETLMIGVR